MFDPQTKKFFNYFSNSLLKESSSLCAITTTYYYYYCCCYLMQYTMSGHCLCSSENPFQHHLKRAQTASRRTLRRINNRIFPDETPLTLVCPRWWWNRMRSSCWNAPAVSVLLGLIGGVCWASHGHTGLASDPKQLLSRQGLQPRMPQRSKSPTLQSGQAHFEKHCSDPAKVSTPAVNVVWRIWLWEAPVFSLAECFQDWVIFSKQAFLRVWPALLPDEHRGKI